MKATYSHRVGELSESWTFEAQRAETVRSMIRHHGPVEMGGTEAIPARVSELPTDAKGAAALAALSFFGVDVDHRGSEGAIDDMRTVMKERYLDAARKRVEERESGR